MMLHLGNIIDHSVDCVAIVDLGESDGRGKLCFEFMGAGGDLPDPGSLVV